VIVVQVGITVAFLPLAASGIFQSNRFSQRAEGIGAARFLTAGVGMDREDYMADSARSPVASASGSRSWNDGSRRNPGVEQIAFSDRLPVEDQFKYRIEADTLAGAPRRACGRARWCTYLAASSTRSARRWSRGVSSSHSISKPGA